MGNIDHLGECLITTDVFHEPFIGEDTTRDSHASFSGKLPQIVRLLNELHEDHTLSSDSRKFDDDRLGVGELIDGSSLVYRDLDEIPAVENHHQLTRRALRKALPDPIHHNSSIYRGPDFCKRGITESTYEIRARYAGQDIAEGIDVTDPPADISLVRFHDGETKTFIVSDPFAHINGRAP
jgi:hypothetical protein